MTILTATELEPLQEARRCAEQHLDAIRTLAIARQKTLPPMGLVFENTVAAAEYDRFSRLCDVASALQTIYDAVSELEFEEEPEPEPVVEEPAEEEELDDEDEDDEEEDE